MPWFKRATDTINTINTINSKNTINSIESITVEPNLYCLKLIKGKK